MHTWIFRHRARLRAIYGPSPAAQGAPAAGGAPGDDPRATALRLAGSIERGESFVLLHPMPRATAA